MSSSSLRLHRSRLLHCLRDPGESQDHTAYQYYSDGALVVGDGKIIAAGNASDLLEQWSAKAEIVDHDGKLIIPGLIDCHVHYPQVDAIASYGNQLLDWLERYTFPEESKFSDVEKCRATAEFFVDELLRNGTTSALVFASVHPQSVNSIFETAQRHSMRLAAGKVLMDRNCPPSLQDTAESAYRDSRELLERWHGQDRLHYAITPRFAPTCSDQQLSLAGQLATEFPDALVHTHLAENVSEVAWVAELFPAARSYLDVYKRFELLRERSVFAHCIHLDDIDRQNLASAGGAVAFCPTSNLFLGSGLFDLRKYRENNIRIGLGTDVGGGTSFSLFRTMSEAYKVLQMQQQSMPGVRGLYLATLGAAESLYIDQYVGNFLPGKEADFVVLDHRATPLLKRRLEVCKGIEEELFVQMMLSDDRSVYATYVLGECAYARETLVG